MLNNIQNGWRPVITKIAIVCGLVYLISVCLPVLASAFNVDSKWTCGTSAEVGESLSDNNEDVVATGIVGQNDFIMTFWANSTGDWTLVATGKDGEHSCVVVHGKKFRTLRSKTFI
jgi:hypothetical protein